MELGKKNHSQKDISPRRRFRFFDWSVYVPKNFGALGRIGVSLRHRNFALYFWGMCIVLVGTWIQQVAMGWLVFSMTNSLFLLSVTVFLSQIPTLFATPFAGVLSDRFDRRNIMLVTQTLMMLQSLVLGILTLTGLINIEIIFALSLFFGFVVSVDAPARQSLYAKLVPAEDLSNAIALNSTAMNGTRFIGPAIGGLLVGAVGEGWCFILGGLTFGAIIFSLLLIKMPPHTVPKKKFSALHEMAEGFRYLSNSMPLRTIMILLAVISFFGIPFPMLIPAFARGTLGGDSQTLGNIMSLIGVGSFVAAIYLAARKSAVGLGRVIVVSGVIFGVSLMAISHVTSTTTAYILAAPIGFGMIALAASSNVMIQSIVEDSKRGRIMSFFSMIFFGIPPIGSIAQAYLANIFSWQNIILFCGAICVIASLVFEYFRPSIRTQARTILAQKDLIIPEIAQGINSTSQKH